MAPQDDPPPPVGAGHVETSPGEANAAGADPTSPGNVPRASGNVSVASGRASGALAEEAHDLRIVVWDTPPAVERGKRFAIKVGLSCSSRRRPAGWMVEVRDQDGETRATTALGDDPWPGTDALYHAEVALTAPDAEGLQTWEAVALTDDPAVGHSEGNARFGVRVVSAPACVLTVVATNAETGSPVEGARVVAHPYRAVTDERGVATLRVPAGEYRLFVSGKGAVPFRFDGEVKTDTTIRAALVQDVALSDADIWS